MDDRPTLEDWQFGEVLADRGKMFVLWLARGEAGARLEDLYHSFGNEFPFAAVVAALERDQFLKRDGERLSLTDRGADAVASLPDATAPPAGRLSGRMKRPPRETKDDDHLAIRLAQLDWSRATEQTAIMLALMVGRGHERRPKKRKEQSTHANTGQSARTDKGKTRGHRGRFFEAKAEASLRGYLQSTFCRGTVGFPPAAAGPIQVESDVPPPGPAGKRPRTRTWRFGTAPDMPGEWDLQCLHRAIDSGDDLKVGAWGVLSVVAGGRSGAFVRPAADRYLVLVTPAARPDLAEAGRDPGDPVATRVTRILGRIRDESPKKFSEFTIGTRPISGSLSGPLERDYPKLLKPLQGDIGRISRMQTLAGSPIAGAVAACRTHFGIDAYFALATAEQASLLAAVAYTMGGGFLALALGPKGQDRTPAAFVGCDAFIRPKEDVFLVATGITDHPILEGVRFKGDQVVSTHTFCSRSHTRSTRFISHHHQLKAKNFHLSRAGGPGPEVEMLDYDGLLAEIGRWLGHDGQPSAVAELHDDESDPVS